jgi:hypothetical protein
MYSVTIHDETEHTVPLLVAQFVQGDKLNISLYMDDVQKRSSDETLYSVSEQAYRTGSKRSGTEGSM